MAYYKGNLGAVEMMKFFEIAPHKLANGVSKLLQSENPNDIKNAWKIIRHVVENPKKPIDEELGPENYWGTPELTAKLKSTTPGQVPEGLEKACWKGYKAVGTKEKDGKTVPNCVPEAFGGLPLSVKKRWLKRGATVMLNGRKEVIDQILPSGRVLLKGKGGPMEVSANDLQPTGGSKLKEALTPDKKKKNLQISMDYVRQKIRDEQNFYKKQEYKDDLNRMQSEYDSLDEAFGQSGLDVNGLASKMGLSKPTTRKMGDQVSYQFKGVTQTKLSASLENQGYKEFDSYTFGYDIVTDHKKGDVVIRVGPSNTGGSWLTIMSDYKDYSAESNSYQNEAGEIYEASNESLEHARQIKIVSLITGESKKQLIEKFIAEHSIIGHELEFNSIRTEFKRFKTLNIKEGWAHDEHKRVKGKYVLYIDSHNQQDELTKRSHIQSGLDAISQQPQDAFKVFRNMNGDTVFQEIKYLPHFYLV